MNRSTPGLPVHHKLPEFTQTHVHRVGDAIQPSHPLSSPSPPALNPSQHQGLFHWVNSLHEVAKVLELQLQHQSFQWTTRTDLLWDGLVGSPCSPRDSLHLSCTKIYSHQHWVRICWYISSSCIDCHHSNILCHLNFYKMGIDLRYINIFLVTNEAMYSWELLISILSQCVYKLLNWFVIKKFIVVK